VRRRATHSLRRGKNWGNTFAEKGQYQGKSLRSIRHTLATGRQQKQVLHQSWVCMGKRMRSGSKGRCTADIAHSDSAQHRQASQLGRPRSARQGLRLGTTVRLKRQMPTVQRRQQKANLCDPIGEGQGKGVLLSQSGGLGSEGGEVQGL